MGFVIKYKRFFNVTLGEEGADDIMAGFTFFPTRECRQLLDNFNLVFRSRSAGFEVFYSESPLISISERVRFSFGFRIPDAGLFKKYGLVREDEDDTTVFQPGFYFDNLNPDGSIISGGAASIVASGTDPEETVSAADTFRMYRQTFKVFDDAAVASPTSYELTHKYEPSLTQTNQVVSEPAAGYLITTINSIDLEGGYIEKSGPYLLEANTESLPRRKVYLNDELGRKGAHGVVDIYWEDAQDIVSDFEEDQEYNIIFKPK